MTGLPLNPLPDDLVDLRVVAQRFPSHEYDDLLQILRRAGVDTMRIGRTVYVRARDFDLWARGCWHSEKLRIAEAAVATSSLPVNRRAAARRA